MGWSDERRRAILFAALVRPLDAIGTLPSLGLLVIRLNILDVEVQRLRGA
jgi:hypothetical protein